VNGRNSEEKKKVQKTSNTNKSSVVHISKSEEMLWAKKIADLAKM